MHLSALEAPRNASRLTCLQLLEEGEVAVRVSCSRTESVFRCNALEAPQSTSRSWCLQLLKGVEEVDEDSSS